MENGKQWVVMEHSYSIMSGNVSPNAQKTEEWRHFDNIISKFLVEQKVPGASVAISKDGIILYQQGYGIAGAGRRVHPGSLFRIASISKPITAAIVMRVCDQLKVPLNSRVFGKAGILKSYKARDKRMKSITIRHLLQHSAGWDRDKVGDAVFVRPPCVVKEHPDSQAYNAALLSYALKRRLEFTPGTWHSYSNLGYLILGEVIETLSGQPYHSVLKEFLQGLNIRSVMVGRRARAHWTSREVEYFNNREPQVVESIYPGEGEVLPQYGGMAMESSASYGGLIADALSLLQFVHCMEETLVVTRMDEQNNGRCKGNVEGRYCDCIDEKAMLCLTMSKSDVCQMDIAGAELLQHSDKTCHEHFSCVSCQREMVSEKCVTEMCGNCHLQKISLKCLGKQRKLDGAVTEKELLYVNNQVKPFLTASQIRESLSQPLYENGHDWYGLGWDVQDNGRSWGHTGGMEGSCGTLFHHQSGLNWAFLLNSWAVDSDLNGVIKCALCSVPQVNMYNQDVLSCDGEPGVRIVTSDKSQIIFVGVGESAILNVVSDMKVKGYFLTWISAMNQDVICAAQRFLINSNKSLETRQTKPVMLGSKYVVIFKKCDIDKYFIMFNKSASELKSIIDKYKEENYVIHFLDSFCDSSSCLKFTAVFRFDDSACSRDSIVRLAVKATEYVKLVKLIVESHYVTVQSVTEVSGDLYVSAIFSSKMCGGKFQSQAATECCGTCQIASIKTTNIWPNLKPAKNCFLSQSNNSVMTGQSHSLKIQENSKNLAETKSTNLAEDSYKPNLMKTFDESSLKSQKFSKSKSRTLTSQNSVYWVQITPESFLTELNRQAGRNNGLIYAKFYTADSKPYVSGCWLPQKEGNYYQRISMSKYGLIPELVEAAALNVCLQCLSEYKEEDGGVYYAAVWYAN